MMWIRIGSPPSNDQTGEIDESLRSINSDMQYAFEKLEIWSLGMGIVKEVYRITKKFPKDELWGLVSQMRRAAVSIPLNVAEGSSRKSRKDFSVYLRRAIGSVLELVTATEIAKGEQYIAADDYNSLKALYEKEYFKLIAFERKLTS